MTNWEPSFFPIPFPFLFPLFEEFSSVTLGAFYLLFAVFFYSTLHWSLMPSVIFSHIFSEFNDNDLDDGNSSDFGPISSAHFHRHFVDWSISLSAIFNFKVSCIDGHNIPFCVLFLLFRHYPCWIGGALDLVYKSKEV